MFPPKFHVIARFTKTERNGVYLIKTKNSYNLNYYILKLCDSKYYKHKQMLCELETNQHLSYKIKNSIVANLVCSFQSKHYYCAIYEFKEGGTVFDNFKDIVKDQHIVKMILAELLLIIEYLHKHNVVHRDIKLENIALDRNGHVSLIDFEMATSKLHNIRGVCGTDNYMAPEITPKKKYNYMVDWWAYAIVAKELFTGIRSKNLKDDLPTDFLSSDLLAKMLNSKMEHRLPIHGVSWLKAHPYFAGLDWNILVRRDEHIFYPQFKINFDSIQDEDLDFIHNISVLNSNYNSMNNTEYF